jgi:hypothetical protein
MSMWFSVAMCAALLGLAALPSPVLAQQKTVKACQDEWRANKADNQAKGITEKAYVAQCRTGGPSAQPASAPAATPAPIPSAATPAPKKTVKACQDEWRANKADNQAKGITEKAYVAQMPHWRPQCAARVSTSGDPGTYSFCGYSRAEEDREGMSRRVESQQGGVPSSKSYRKGVCR